MWKVNDYLVYGKDVCIVKDILEKNFNDEDYYLLVPIKDKSLKIKVPTSNKSNKLRNIISKDDMEKIINNIPNIEPIITDDKFLEHEYKNLLTSNNHEDLIKIIKTTYLRNKERLNNNKKTTEKDNTYFNLAEEYLYNEFSVVLGYDFDETKKYIIKKVESIIK